MKTEVSEPLEPWVERVIDRALQRHQNRCPIIQRVQVLEVKFAALIGYMAGSGMVGGAAGALIARLLTS